SGNRAQGSFKGQVLDRTAPALTVPADVSVEATGASGAAVSYSASALDSVDGAVAVSCSPASGSTFAIGSTTVNCSAADAHSNSASGSFVVRVADHVAPVLTVPGDLAVAATSTSGAVVSYAVSANDAVDGAVAPSCSKASGSGFPLAVTTVTCSAADKSGNQ